MRITSSTLVALTALATTGTLAADEVVSIYMPYLESDEDPGVLVGKELGHASNTTTYSITCISSAATCDFGTSGTGATIIQAPSTYTMLGQDTNGTTRTAECAISSSTASCSLYTDGKWWDLPTDTGMKSWAVTVTAADGASASATATPAITSPGAGTGANATGSANGTSATGDEANPTDSDNAAIAQITGMPWGVGVGAGAVLMGVAAVL
ncbi:hypothetical protein BDW74DRAFT_175239 [Aspergillus multicolor]|uniref:uncharacterized protein n=1 Tax=Aspergillus multicolor TaxID=41759 RepID=UPI003CCE2D2B